MGPTPSPVPTIPHVTGPISYPVEQLLSISLGIQRSSQQALEQLPQMSNKLSAYVDGFPETMQESLTGFLSAYTARVEHSYKTQLLFAAWLELAASEMQKSDGQIGTSFAQFLTEVAENKIRPNY